MFQRRRFKGKRSGISVATSSGSSKGGGYINDYEYSQQPNQTSSLANFDVCVEACDAIAASSGGSLSGGRRIGSPRISHSFKNESGFGANPNLDSSAVGIGGGPTIMISPDGELLSCSNHGHLSHLSLEQNDESGYSDDDSKEVQDLVGNGDHDDFLIAGENTESPKSTRNQKVVTNHESKTSPAATGGGADNGVGDDEDKHSEKSKAVEVQKGEFESSIFIGNDIVPDGEKVLNGFSARGWNPVMTTMAIRRAVDTLQ